MKGGIGKQSGETAFCNETLRFELDLFLRNGNEIDLLAVPQPMPFTT